MPAYGSFVCCCNQSGLVPITGLEVELKFLMFPISKRSPFNRLCYIHRPRHFRSLHNLSVLYTFISHTSVCRFVHCFCYIWKLIIYRYGVSGYFIASSNFKCLAFYCSSFKLHSCRGTNIYKGWVVYASLTCHKLGSITTYENKVLRHTKKTIMSPRTSLSIVCV